jgi:hypothetical protein
MTERSTGVDQLERFSRIGTLIALAVALGSAVAAPLLALSWSNRPFPGFLVEPSLLVTRQIDPAWPGIAAGIAAPQRIVRIAGQAVATSADYQRVLSEHDVGEVVPVFTALADGRPRLFPDIQLISFPFPALVRLFLSAYLIGVAYLIIGMWVYQLRGQTRPGRVLSFFCYCAATTCMLIFDLWTTHTLAPIWTVALALTGGAILSLAMRFPVEWSPVQRRPWLLTVPYGLAMALAAWGLYALNLDRRPIAYAEAWAGSYRYLAVAILVLFAVTSLRSVAAESVISRRQARIMLMGSVVAFVPVTVWFLAPVAGFTLTFEPLVYLTPLVVFPIAIWVAILRYRLLDVDDLVSRTVLYGVLTAILAGVYAITITISQKLFVTITGEKSDGAIVLTTLIVVSVVTPLKERLQGLLDRRLRSVGERGAELRRFADQVRLYTQLGQPERVARRFLQEAATGLRAESGAVSVCENGHWRTVDTFGRWMGETWLSVGLSHGGQRFGVVSLGPPAGRPRYTEQERDVLGAVAADIGTSLAFVAATSPTQPSTPEAAA